MSNTMKSLLRTQLKKKRKAYPFNIQAKHSRVICEKMIELDAFKTAKHIALYQAAFGEVNLQTLWETALKKGKRCYFPVLKDDLSLLFLPADKDTLWQNNRFGIQQPCVSVSMAQPADALDIICMPLLGFDEHGHRIGMGAGYYDRTLAESKHTFLAGIAYDFQKIDDIKPDPWDIPMNVIITEQAIYWSKP